MKRLSKFLNKFKILIKDDTDLKKEVAETIKEVTGIKIEENLITFNKNGSISIKCQTAIRSEIFIKKELILSSLNNKISERKFSDILF